MRYVELVDPARKERMDNVVDAGAVFAGLVLAGALMILAALLSLGRRASA